MIPASIIKCLADGGPMIIEHHDCGSANRGPLAKGCQHCVKGGKMVLFVTGRCDTGCFYCPVSAEKKGKDVVYANERKISSMDEIIEEAEQMDATGTGITGGDPLMNMERTVSAIKLLKGHFGKEHHIHLYTSTMDAVKVSELADAGLDEIRFHPSEKIWGSMEKTELAEIAKMPLDVGIEVPALPGHHDDLSELISYAASVGIKFVNLNELEFSESNWDMMERMNYGIKDELSSAVDGSEEIGMTAVEEHDEIPVHFCSSSFKDGVQLRNRLVRMADHNAEEYDVVTEDGTILRGLAYPDDLDAAISILKEKYDVPDELIHKDSDKKRLEVASWVLEELADELPFKCYISEQYPTADHLEVERTPLN